jgi:TRAP-type C4-dicarboxylate transport system substrate-binding protein
MPTKLIARLCGAVALAFCAFSWAQQPIVLKLNSGAPVASMTHTKAFTPWAADVTRASEGTLQVQTFYGGALGNFGVTYDRVVDGVADIGFILASFAGGKFKLLDVSGLPFEAKNALEASTALWRLYEKGVISSEFDVVKPLALFVFSNAAIHSKQPVRTLQDVKGKRMTAGNPVTARIVAALGATPTPFRPDELYQVLSRGTAEASLINFNGMAAFKLQEVTRYHLDVPLGGDPALLFINKKKYDGLPPKARAAVDKYSYLALTQKLGEAIDQQWIDSRNLVKDRVVTLSASEEEQWRKALAPVAGQWAKDTPNGAKVLAAFREEIRAYRNAR